LNVRLKPSDDLVFKNIFLKLSNKDLLVALLNEILNEYNEPIEDIELITAEIIPDQFRFIFDDLENSNANEKKDETETDKKKEKKKEKISGKKGYMDGLIRNLTKEKTKSKDNMILKAKTKSNVINIKIQILDENNMFKNSLFLQFFNYKAFP